jgi:hypothetical protein
MTLYPLMGLRRQEKIAKVIEHWKQVPVHHRKNHPDGFNAKEYNREYYHKNKDKLVVQQRKRYHAKKVSVDIGSDIGICGFLFEKGVS